MQVEIRKLHQRALRVHWWTKPIVVFGCEISVFVPVLLFL